MLAEVELGAPGFHGKGPSCFPSPCSSWKRRGLGLRMRSSLLFWPQGVLPCTAFGPEPLPTPGQASWAGAAAAPRGTGLAGRVPTSRSTGVCMTGGVCQTHPISMGEGTPVTKTAFLRLRSRERFPAIYAYLTLPRPLQHICPPGSSPQGSHLGPRYRFLLCPLRGCIARQEEGALDREQHWMDGAIAQGAFREGSQHIRLPVAPGIQSAFIALCG